MHALADNVNAPVRALIVDDESPARRGLALRLARFADVEIVGEAANGREAVAAVNALRPDLMFLDVQMPGIDGFGVLRALPAERLPLVVFVTAYDRHAVQAFEAHALDYLLKPIPRPRLAGAVQRVRETLAARQAVAHTARLLKLLGQASGQSALASNHGLSPPAHAPIDAPLPIRDGDRTRLVPQADIAWIDAAGDYMCVHASGHTYVTRTTLAALLARLDPHRFRRIHRSTLVNLTHVRELRTHANGEAIVTLRCGQTLKLSRRYRDQLRPRR